MLISLSENSSLLLTYFIQSYLQPIVLVGFRDGRSAAYKYEPTGQ